MDAWAALRVGKVAGDAFKIWGAADERREKLGIELPLAGSFARSYVLIAKTLVTRKRGPAIPP